MMSSELSTLEGSSTEALNEKTDALPEQTNEMSPEEELQSARRDAQETLEALLRFSEGVRLITRHMHNATADDSEEESKSEQEDPSLHIERMISDSCLKGTVFGTDLLRLCDAAHHVRDYARLATEESTVSTHDLVAAQRAAKRAIQRTKKAESLAINLHRQNQELRQQVDQLTSEKRCLVQEVKTLRQEAATARKLHMERLVQQHVTGAILLHEEQLKAMAIAAQKQKNLRRNRAEEEEEKKEEDDNDMELVKAEDCVEASAPPKKTPAIEVVSNTGDEEKEKETIVVGENAPESQEPKGEESDAKPHMNEKQSSNPRTPDSSKYAPIKLLPSVGQTTPPPHSSSNERPSSSRSVGSEQSTSSAVLHPPPQQPKENVGSKIMTFLFYPEKMGQQRLQEEMERQRRLERDTDCPQQQQQQQQPPPKQAAAPVPATKLNPRLGIVDLVGEKEDASVDATVPTQAATTPGSTCASSRRARSLSGDRLPNTNESTQNTPKHNSRPEIPNVIPNCVSFSDDTLSVQSNLPSPKFQNSSRQASSEEEDDEERAIIDVELYKDFKMFRSLAIPADDEIDEYRQSRHQEQNQ